MCMGNRVTIRAKHVQTPGTGPLSRETNSQSQGRPSTLSFRTHASAHDLELNNTPQGEEREGGGGLTFALNSCSCAPETGLLLWPTEPSSSEGKSSEAAPLAQANESGTEPSGRTTLVPGCLHSAGLPGVGGGLLSERPARAALITSRTSRNSNACRRGSGTDHRKPRDRGGRALFTHSSPAATPGGKGEKPGRTELGRGGQLGGGKWPLVEEPRVEEWKWGEEEEEVASKFHNRRIPCSAAYAHPSPSVPRKNGSLREKAAQSLLLTTSHQQYRPREKMHTAPENINSA
ncbi:hypothetical protein MHYP_G00053630 [Metynnis hypsauchen]